MIDLDNYQNSDRTINMTYKHKLYSIKESKVFKPIFPSLLISIFVFGCATETAISEKTRNLQSPTSWQSQLQANADKKSSSVGEIVKTDENINEFVELDGWLSSLKDPMLTRMVHYALQHNYQLKAQFAAMSIAQQKLNISNASDLPELSLAMTSSRNKRVTNAIESYQTNNELGLQLSYEVDLWGRLSDQQLQDKLNFAAAKSIYEGSKISLVAELASSWFSLVEASQLLALYQNRADNLQHNLSTIQASYRLGLSQALDVYLTQSDVNREFARVADQKQVVLRASRQLELLMGDYPRAKLSTNKTLPVITDDIPTGLPGELLTRRTDIRASWYELLALDAGLAVAHKAKFPRISLNANTGTSSDELSNLLDVDTLAWSLIGNITMPLFNAGKLDSLEEQARLRVVQKEQEYLGDVYQAFANVEEQISNRSALKEQFSHYSLAKENALAAEDLSFNQYLKGLVSYTTVLESQRRAFDAQTSLIQLTNQLLQNRISVYVALGGNFKSSETLTATNITPTVLASNFK